MSSSFYIYCLFYFSFSFPSNFKPSNYKYYFNYSISNPTSRHWSGSPSSSCEVGSWTSFTLKFGVFLSSATPLLSHFQPSMVSPLLVSWSTATSPKFSRSKISTAKCPFICPNSFKIFNIAFSSFLSSLDVLYSNSTHFTWYVFVCRAGFFFQPFLFNCPQFLFEYHRSADRPSFPLFHNP